MPRLAFLPILFAAVLALPASAQAPGTKKPAPPPPSTNAAPSQDELAADLHLVRAKQHLDAGRFQQAAEEMDAIVRLGDRVRIPTDFHYHYARCLVGAKRFDEGIASARRYIDLAGRGGTFYAQALEILASVEEQRTAYLRDLVARCQTRAQELSFRLSDTFWDSLTRKSYPCIAEVRLSASPEGVFTLDLWDKTDLLDEHLTARFSARDLIAARGTHYGHDSVYGHIDNLASLDIFVARPSTMATRNRVESRLFLRFFSDNLFKANFKSQRSRIEAIVAFLNTDGLELARALGGTPALLAPPDPDARIVRMIETLPPEVYRTCAEGSRQAFFDRVLHSMDGNPNERVFQAHIQKLAATLP